MKKKKMKKNTSLRKRKKKAEGFIRKFEEQVDFYEFFQNIHYELHEGVSYEQCAFCHSGTNSVKIDLVKKTFSCSVYGLKGGLVLFVMLFNKINLRTALRYIAENYWGIDVSVIPHHVLIP